MNQYEIDFKQGYDRANEEWLDRIKQAREEIIKKIDTPVCGEYIKQGYNWGLRDSLTILDKLITESEG